MTNNSFDFPDVLHGSPAFSDRFHPIVVRQMRRLVRSSVFKWAVMLYLVIAGVSIVGGLMIAGARPLADPLQIWNLIGTAPFLYFVSIGAIVPAFSYSLTQRDDDFLNHSFTPKQLLRGYMMLGLLISGFFASLALPFIALAAVFGGNLGFMLWGLFFQTATGVTSNLMYFSYFCKLRQWILLLVVFFVAGMITGWQFAALGFLEAAMTTPFFVHAINSATGLSISALPAVALEGPKFIGYICFESLLFAFVAYFLCRWHLSQPKRLAVLDMLLNVLFYSLTTLFVCGLWMILRYGGIIVG